MTSLSRIYNLDAIRGLAVLGILLMNIFFFASPFYGYAELSDLNNADSIVNLISSLLFETRFISLFSILFGVGLCIQFEALERRGLNAYALTSKRLQWLIFFGFLHALFIWSGDILLTYGACGYLALNYRRDSAQLLMTKAVQFMGIGILLTYLWFVLLENKVLIRHSTEFMDQYKLWTGCYSEQIAAQFLAIINVAFTIPLGALWYIGGLMLLGMSLYKLDVFSQGLSIKWLAICIGMSLICFALDIAFQQTSHPYIYQLSEIMTIIGGVFTALIYLHIIVKVCNNRATSLKALQNVGRLAFSLYILQSLVGVGIFRYWMPQWSLDFERVDYLLLAISGCFAQLLIASLYFTYFKQGPLEKFWRYLVFRRVNSIEKDSKVISG